VDNCSQPSASASVTQSPIGEDLNPQDRPKHLEASASNWPALETLILNNGIGAYRRESVGGSDANIILSGHADRIRQLWLEKRGEAEPPDLSANLPVMLGCWTEPFNRQWF